MPSHQIRVQQNNCNHEWYYYFDQLNAEFLKEYRKCIKCGKSEQLEPLNAK